MSTPTKRKFHDGSDIEQLQQQQQQQQQPDKKLKSTHNETTTTAPPTTESAIELKKRLLREKIQKSKQQLENIISVDQSVKQQQAQQIQSPPVPVPIETTTTSGNKDEDSNNDNNSMFYDPRIIVSSDKRKKLNSFTFIQPGRYSKKADKLRSQALAEEMKKQVELNALKSKKTESMDTFISIDQVPDLEWWDIDILNEQSQQKISPPSTTTTAEKDTEETASPSIEAEKEKEKEIKKIKEILTVGNNEELIKSILNTEYWGYIEHPVKIKTIIQSKDTTPPPIRPDFLLLTKERKRMRKQRRAEMARERQERIINGLEAPPENKVKLSNLMRVIGTQAIIDPTKALLEVTKKMNQRKAEHDKVNQDRKLTSEQRKEKKRDKLLMDAKQELYCSIYKVIDLSHPLHRSIIGKSSNENLGSGCIVFHPSCNLVIFEGGLKVQKKFKKLMLNRIDWENPPPIKQKEQLNENGEVVNNIHGNSSNSNSDLFPKPPDGTVNSCHLVWTGPIHEPHFKGFHYEISPLESQARKYLQEHSVPHYWDMIKNFSPEY